MVDPHRVSLIWPCVRRFIEAAYQYPSDDTFAEIERDVLSGCAQLWVSDDLTAAGITKVWNYRSKKICTVIAVGGSGDWPDLLKPIEDYAERQGCTSLRMEGRRGWARILKDYEQPWIVLEKRFADARRGNV